MCFCFVRIGIFSKHTPSDDFDDREGNDSDLTSPSHAARSGRPSATARSLLGGSISTRKPRVRVRAGAGSSGGGLPVPGGGLFGRGGHAKFEDDGDADGVELGTPTASKSDNLSVHGGAKQHKRARSKKGLTLRKRPSSTNSSIDFSSPKNDSCESPSNGGMFDDFPQNKDSQTLRTETTLYSEEGDSSDSNSGSDESIFGKQVGSASSSFDDTAALANADASSPKVFIFVFIAGGSVGDAFVS